MAKAIKNKTDKLVLQRAGRSIRQNEEKWMLRLYIAGNTPKCSAALLNLRRYCEQHLNSRYEIEVIDLLLNPQLAAGDQILAIPTLVRKMPVPVRKIIGDL